MASGDGLYSTGNATPAPPKREAHIGKPDPKPADPTHMPRAPAATQDHAVYSKERIDGIIKSLHTIYTSKSTAEQDQVIDRAYAEQGIFEDNIAQVVGKSSIKAQFHALAKFFKECRMDVKGTQLKDDASGPILLIESEQQYDVARRTIKLHVDTAIQVDSNGLIVVHKDVWRDSFNGWGFVKRAFGASSSLFYRAIRL